MQELRLWRFVRQECKRPRSDPLLQLSSRISHRRQRPPHPPEYRYSPRRSLLQKFRRMYPSRYSLVPRIRPVTLPPQARHWMLSDTPWRPRPRSGMWCLRPTTSSPTGYSTSQNVHWSLVEMRSHISCLSTPTRYRRLVGKRADSGCAKRLPWAADGSVTYAPEPCRAGCTICTSRDTSIRHISTQHLAKARG